MKLRSIIYALLVAGAACQARGPSTHAVREACTAGTDCGDGLVCSSGVCVAPLPTASQYRACAIDLDCSAGDHCDLGACTHDCVADRDCSTGETCDLRGRCATPAAANQPPAPAPPTIAAPVLRVGETQLDFATFDDEKTLTVENTGDAPLAFRVMADRTWLSATPVTGTVAPGTFAVVTITVQSAGTGIRGAVAVVSTGGAATVGVSVPATLAGLYQGEVHITSPSELGTRALALGLAQETSGALRGVVDDARSPAFGFRAPLAPESRVSGQKVSLKFVIPGRSGSGGNPSYPHDLRRTIAIDGTTVPGGGIEGTYVETIEGPLSSPTVLSGPVVFGAVDRAATLLPPQTDGVVLQAPARPTFFDCDSCPSGACPKDHVQAGRDFLKAAFKFYDSPLAEGTGDAYAPIRACVGAPATCYDPIALHCAQAHFYTAVQEGGAHACPELGGADCAQRGLLDTFKGLLVWNSLIGNEHLVAAYGFDRPLEDQRTELDAARTAFTEGLLGANKGGAPVRGVLTPFFLEWMSSLPASTWSSPQTSFLPEHLRVPPDSDSLWTVAPFGDFAHLAASLELWIQSLRSVLVTQHKLAAAAPERLVIEAGRAVAETHLALAFAAALQAKMTARDTLSKAVSQAAQLSTKVRDIGDGFNPAGFPDQYIAYTYKPGVGAESNNYLKLNDEFSGRWMKNASTAHDAAKGLQRDFESSYQQLTKELVSVNADYGRRVAELCGGIASAPTLMGCGLKAGLVFDTFQQLQSANMRLQNANASVRNQQAQIEIEQHRAAEQVNLHEVEAIAINMDGTALKNLQDKETIVDMALAAAQAASGGFSSPGQAVGAGIAGTVGVAAAWAKGEIAKERINIDTLAKARVEFNQAQSQLVDSAARIKTLALEIPLLRINALLAVQDIGRLVGQLGSQMQEARDTMAAMTTMQQLAAADPRRDPAFRQYRNRTTVLANKAFDEAQGQLFLVTRALEYEIGMSFARRAELFRIVSPLELESYAADLELTYQRFIAKVGNSQDRETTLSLRDQIYRFSEALQDNCTGGSYAPDELFRRLLADPRNRDADGNVRLSFSLPLAQDALFFNRGYCTDKITGIRISLVGSQLGATQPEVGLQQRGSAYLRSCTDTDAGGEYVVSEYNLENTVGVRRAIIQAGLNLSASTDMSSGGPLNTELYGRPVSAPYELIIDRNEPANAKLDLTKLDDIVLFIRHETRTVH